MYFLEFDLFVGRCAHEHWTTLNFYYYLIVWRRRRRRLVQNIFSVAFRKSLWDPLSQFSWWMCVTIAACIPLVLFALCAHCLSLSLALASRSLSCKQNWIVVVHSFWIVAAIVFSIMCFVFIFSFLLHISSSNEPKPIANTSNNIIARHFYDLVSIFAIFMYSVLVCRFAVQLNFLFCCFVQFFGAISIQLCKFTPLVLVFAS